MILYISERFQQTDRNQSDLHIEVEKAYRQSRSKKERILVDQPIKKYLFIRNYHVTNQRIQNGKRWRYVYEKKDEWNEKYGNGYDGDWNSVCVHK